MFNVSCESTCDIPFEHMQKRNCKILFYTYTIDDCEFVDDMWRTQTALPALFEALKTKRPRTSQINVDTYEQFFLEQLKQGDLLHVTFSSGLSKSAENAMQAAERANKTRTGHKVVVVDSLCSSGGYGLLMDGVLNKRDQGMNFQQLCEWTKENRLRVHHFFFSTDLTYYRRSGRISGAAAFVGNVLKICPVMRLDKQGKIVAYAKAITPRKAMAKLVDETKAHADQDFDPTMFLQHSNCLQTAQQTQAALAKAFPQINNFAPSDLGIVICCHCGPNTVAVFFWGDKRAY